MWAVIAEPFRDSVEAEATGLEWKDPVNEVVDAGRRRWEGVVKGFGDFENIHFFVEYFWR